MLPLQFSSVTQSCLTLWDQINRSRPGLPVTNSCSLPKLMYIETVMPSNHLILYHSLLLLLSIFPSIRFFLDESVLLSKWPKYWSFSISISPSNEYSGLIPFRMTGWISMQSRGLSRVFSNTIVQKSINYLEMLL